MVIGNGTTTSPKDDSDEELRKESSYETVGLPTPSCTGSMDSLSSSSCSDRQMTSFTTFGRITPQSSLDETTTIGANVLPSTEAKLTVGQECGRHADETLILCAGGGQENNSKRISDSTDEDSGIENISRRIN